MTGEGRPYDHGEQSLEIKKIKKSIFNFTKDPDISVHEYGADKSDPNKTYRAKVTRDGQPTVLGWKLIRMALMGRSWRYISRQTGLSFRTIKLLFSTNPVIREAVVEMETQVIEDSKSLLIRNVRKVTKNLIEIARGDKSGSADRMKAELDAIREVYNRVGFLTPTRGGGGQGGNVVIRIEGGEARDLGLLMGRRNPQLTDGSGADGDENEEVTEERPGGRKGEAEGGAVDDGPVAGGGGGEDAIEGELAPRD